MHDGISFAVLEARRRAHLMRGRKIGVLCGGLSAEREVSLRTGEAICAALVDRGHDAERVFVDRDLDLVLRQARIDVAFLALHGRWGEDGCVQGLLELLGIPYTGSDVLSSALAMNKVKAKEVFRLHNLPTPPYHVLTRPEIESLREIHGAFGFPAVVKPSGEGSSVGVAIARDHAELEAACEAALRFDDEVLVERFVDGKEVSVAILSDRALGGIEIVPRQGFYDYSAKYTAGRSDYHMPARLSPERYRGVLTQALGAHRALGCAGATRVDMIVSDRGNEYVLEVNTIPGMTPTSLLPKIAHHAGLSFGDLVEEILGGARLWASGKGRSERRVAQAPFEGPDKRAVGGVVERH
jgi:D-alanine-D-alanine ligase